jgi:hypothetical protein
MMNLEYNMNEDNQEMTINDFINAVGEKEFNRAESIFSSVLGDKVNTALDAEKVAVASDIFNEPLEDETDLESELESELEEEDSEEESVAEEDAA